MTIPRLLKDLSNGQRVFERQVSNHDFLRHECLEERAGDRPGLPEVAPDALHLFILSGGIALLLAATARADDGGGGERVTRFGARS